MTKGIYIHKRTGEAYELLDDKVINKDSESRCCLYCKVGDVQQWYVREISHFQKSFTLKKD